MRNTILFSIFILFLFSCNKHKYTTAPQLKYKSVNKKELHRGEVLQITLSFTDAEGDLSTDSALYVRKVVPRCASSSFDQYYLLPPFPTGKDQSGDILVTYSYNDVNPLCNRNDTAVFKFILRDKAKNKSDTAVSDQIIIYN
jgi:hypothetical protein